MLGSAAVPRPPAEVKRGTHLDLAPALWGDKVIYGLALGDLPRSAEACRKLKPTEFRFQRVERSEVILTLPKRLGNNQTRPQNDL